MFFNLQFSFLIYFEKYNFKTLFDFLIEIIIKMRFQIKKNKNYYLNRIEDQYIELHAKQEKLARNEKEKVLF